jgi:Zn-dependent protease with chaperone function
VLFVYSVFAIEMLTLHGVHFGVLVAAAAAAVTTCYALLRSAFGAMKDEPLIVQAVALNRTEHPAVFRLVKDTAATLKVNVPDHVIVGLEPTFFVTISDVVLASDGGEVLRGRTLFLSFSLMSVFTIDELRSVIGHELGHFRGADLSYSLKFAPMYARLRRAIYSLDHSAGIAATVGRIPAIAALSTCLLEFATAERAVGRERELLADQSAVQVAHARTCALALIKGALLTSQWDEVTQHHVDLLQRGQAMPRLCEAYALRCSTFIGNLNLHRSLEELGASVQLHPVDTHPQLLLRLERLHTSLQDIERAELALPVESSARRVFLDARALDERLSALRTQSIIASTAIQSDTNLPN